MSLKAFVVIVALIGCAGVATCARPDTSAPTAADELVANLVGEDLSSSFKMHVVRQTPAVQAAGALIKMKDDAVPALAKALEWKDVLQRLNVVFVLDRIGTPATIPALIHALSDESPKVRALSVAHLPVWTDEKARTAAMNALKDEDGKVRKAAAGAFEFDMRRRDRRSETGPDNNIRYTVASAILPLLDDPDTRYAAARALGTIGMNVAAKPLAKALAEDTGSVRTVILEAIGQLGDKQVTLDVLPFLQDKDALIRPYAARTLGELADIRATLALVRASSDPQADLRGAAAAALGQIGDRRGVPSLITLLKDSDKLVSGTAAKALAQVGDPAAIKPLIDMLRSKSPAAESAAFALGQFRDPSTIEALRVYLMDKPESEVAAKALGNIPHPDSVAALISVAIKGKSNVARGAVGSLIGCTCTAQSETAIEAWWKANRGSYFPDSSNISDPTPAR
jgi:HEAT repeat protein